MKLPSKEQMLDDMGRPITQSLFLEINYTDMAVYTLKDDDHELNGKQYPSLKKLYLECEDPTEYVFATTYLIGWKHWLRLCENKAIRKHIDEWREELEIKLRSRGVHEVIKAATRPGGLQAAKWLADRGWASRPAGRPSKAEVEREREFAARVSDEFSADILRLK
jgi:hypothetical protein